MERGDVQSTLFDGNIPEYLTKLLRLPIRKCRKPAQVGEESKAFEEARCQGVENCEEALVQEVRA